MLTFVVRSAATLGGRAVQPGDVIRVHVGQHERPVVLAAEMVHNEGELLGALVEGVLDPINLAPSDAVEIFEQRRRASQPPRLLDLTARLARDASA